MKLFQDHHYNKNNHYPDPKNHQGSCLLQYQMIHIIIMEMNLIDLVNGWMVNITLERERERNIINLIFFKTIKDTNDYTITTSTSNNNNNNTRSNRAIEFTERTLEINHEFLENKETIYFEKIKKLQDELSAIQHGGHEEFEEYIIDMEKERSKEIKNAQLYMEYRIQCAEKLYNDALHAVEEEAEVEKRDLKKAMLFIIEEKRKRIKEYRDEEISLTNDFVITVPQTRSNRRRTRGITTAISVEGIIDGTLTLEQILAVNKNNGVKTIKRRNNDRSRDSTALNHSLSARNETELEADYKAMRKDTKQEHMNVTSTTTTTTTMGTLSDNDDDDDDDDEYREDEKDISSSSKRARSHNYPNSNGTHPRSSRR
ncbi:Sds3-like-domain-containing protein [Circinella umbellata]|nr:Sds3-like-domain-containing protein [Circinella umbellata]